MSTTSVRDLQPTQSRVTDTIPDVILSTEEYYLLTTAVAAAEHRFAVALSCHLTRNPLRRSDALSHVDPPLLITITPRPRFPPQLLSRLLPLALPSTSPTPSPHPPHEAIHFHPAVLPTLQLLVAEFGRTLSIPESVAHVATSLSERSQNPPTEEHIGHVLQPSLWPHLFPFQRKGVTFAIRSASGRVLIADDMGMGKTLQALAIADYYRRTFSAHSQEAPPITFILCPATLRLAWKQAIIRWLPTASLLSVHLVKSPSHFKALMSSNCRAHKDPWDNSLTVSYVICTYDLLPRLADVQPDENTSPQVFSIVIADECHLLKNHTTARTRAALPILLAASTRILISGTPALSKAIDLYPLMKSIFHSSKSPYFSYQQFLDRYCGGSSLSCSISSNVEELHDILSSVMIRRLKDHGEIALPPKYRTLVTVHFQREKLHYISQLLDRTQKISEILSSPHDPQTTPLLRAERETLFTSLYSKTAMVKLRPLLVRILKHLQPSCPIGTQNTDEIEGRNKKVIVFAHHVQILDAVESFINGRGFLYIRIDGTVGLEEREDAVRKFQNDARVRVAILSLQVAGVGLSFTSADVVIFAELSWVPAMLIQAEDRVHRIGRSKPVNIEYLFVSGSLDDTMMSVIQGKQDMISRTVDGCSHLRDNSFINSSSTFSFKERLALSESDIQCALDDCNTEVLATTQDNSNVCSVLTSVVSPKQ